MADLIRSLRESQKGKVKRAVFLANLAPIKEALEGGYSLHTVWKVSVEIGTLEMSYPQFCRYAKAFIPTDPAPETGVKRKPSNSSLPQQFRHSAIPLDKDELV
jgi:hypothetical protein